MARETTEFIQTLVADLKPVKPVRLERLFGLCLAVEVVVVMVAAWATGLRADIAERLSDWTFLLLVATLAVAAASSAVVALRLSVPGRDVPAQSRVFLFIYPVVMALLVLALRPWGSSWPGFSPFLNMCWRCIGVTSAAAVVPWVGLIVVLGGLAPLNGPRVGLFAGLSAFLVGALATQFHCASGDGYHLAFGHYLPIAILAALTTLVAAPLLRVRAGLTDSSRDT